MEAGWEGADALPAELRDRLGLAGPPAVVLAMGRGDDRDGVVRALDAGGWSVSLVEDGFALLDHLASTLASARIQVPVLALIELSVGGPRLGELCARVRGIVPAMPVLLLCPRRLDVPDGTLLRYPFLPNELMAAVARALGAPVTAGS
jgi:hypothetical protein